MTISIYDRIKKKIVKEPVYGALFLRALYPTSRLGQVFAWPILQLTCRLPWASALYGYLQRQPASKKKIAPFIKTYGVDAREFEKSEFNSFDDFFVRHLKKSARPIGKEIIAPADGRYRFIPSIGKEDFFYAKGQRLNLKKLLGNAALAKRFEGGSLVIARLAPPDYHRFHFPLDGNATAARMILGPLFSVNPRSLRQNLSHLTENKRFVTEISSEAGAVAYIEIGATFVGSVHHTQGKGTVKKGGEKGFFSFGASALILLFEKDRITFEPDLFEGPKGLEVRCLMGETIARLKST